MNNKANTFSTQYYFATDSKKCFTLLARLSFLSSSNFNESFCLPSHVCCLAICRSLTNSWRSRTSSFVDELSLTFSLKLLMSSLKFATTLSVSTWKGRSTNLDVCVFNIYTKTSVLSCFFDVELQF